MAPPTWAAPAATEYAFPGSAPCNSTLQACIDGASDGDTIVIAAGTYVTSFTLNKAVNLTGVASNTVILQALSGQRVLTVTGAAVVNSVVISGLTFTGGDLTGAVGFPDNCGGGFLLENSAQPLVANVIFTGNTAIEGGGMCADNSTLLRLTDSVVISNSATSGGGISVRGAVQIYGGRVESNACLTFGCEGGGLYAGGLLSVTGTQFLSNTSQARGGGFRATSAVVLVGALFLNNHCLAANCGGGALDTSGALTATNTQFLDNSSGGGGGGAVVTGPALVSQSLFQDNWCTASNCGGGGLLVVGQLNMTGTQFISNSALLFGGGVYAFNSVVLTQGVFVSNTCTGGGCLGGGLQVGDGLTLTGTQFTANTSKGSGGAINVTGAATVTAGLVQSNTCSGGGCQGGGLAVGAALVLSNTQLISNTAQSDGGGVAAGGPAVMSGGVFRGNQCLDSACVGGGLQAFDTLALTGTQFLSNTAQNGGGAIRTGGPVTATGGLFQHNQCANTGGCDGGGLYAASTLSVNGTQFISNTAHARGGGVSAYGAATLTSALFQDNACLVNTGDFCLGGGLYSASSLVVTGTQFLSNSALLRAGGLFADGAAAMTGGLFQANKCAPADCLGGGMAAGSSLNMTGTLFLTNTAGGNAGGLVAYGPATITSALFRANACTEDGCQGGGLFAFDALVLSGTQFLSNTSRLDGAGAAAGVTATVTGGVFQGNVCAQTTCQGGALLVGGGLTLRDTQLLRNTAGKRAGAAYVNGVAVLTGGLFQGNACNQNDCEGGGLYAGSSLSLTGTQFISNTSRANGGGAYAIGAAAVSSGLFERNTCGQAGCQGGGLFVFANSPLTLTGTAFMTNTAFGSGGGASGLGTVAVSGGQFQANACTQAGCFGGGLYGAASIVLSATQVMGNVSRSDGGGLYASGAANLSGGLLQGNACAQDSCRGGGLYAGGALTLTNTSFLTNTARGDGAGAAAFNAATVSGGLFQGNGCTQDNCAGGGLYTILGLTLSNTELISNTARDDGGGVWAGDDTRITGGLFERNACAQDDCQGGGLHAVTNVTISGTTFLSNTARFSAGGVYGNSGAATVVNGGLFQGNNCTQTACRGGGLNVNGSVTITGTQFVGNRAVFDGGGLRTAGAATVTTAVFEANTAFQGGGFYHAGGAGQVVNTLFANNIGLQSGAALYVNGSGGLLQGAARHHWHGGRQQHLVGRAGGCWQCWHHQYDLYIP